MSRYSYKNIERRAIAKAEKDPIETAFLAGGAGVAAYGAFTQNQTATTIGVMALIGYGLFKYLS